jgi:two-component system OmpR family response regulator
MPQHILVVDDDPTVRSFLERYLVKHGYAVTGAGDGAAMRRGLEGERAVDLVIMDLMLPGEDGLALTRFIRSTSNLPIIMVTAREDTVDRVIGLEVGADDYLPKPFEARELLARIRSVLRRVNGAQIQEPSLVETDRIACFADWKVNLSTRQVFNSETNVPVGLTAAEFDLLRAFLEHPRKVLSRDQLLDMARGREAFNVDRSIDVHVMRLRRKIERDPSHPTLITTVHGAGYMFSAHVRWV